QKSSMIPEGLLYAGSDRLCFIMAPRVHVGDRHELGVRQFNELMHQLLAPGAGAYNSQANPVVGAKHAARGQCKTYRGRGARLLEELSAFEILTGHIRPPSLID